MNNLFDGLLVSAPNGGGLFLLREGVAHMLDDLNTTGISVEGRRILRGLQPDHVISYGSPSSNPQLEPGALRDVHDVLNDGEAGYIVCTDSNEIIKFNIEGKEVRRWIFNASKDSWHINCVARWNNNIIFSAFGEFSSYREYKNRTDRAGFVQNLYSGERIITGLSQPHSLTPFQGNLLLANSEYKEIIEYDKSGQRLRSKKFDGFTRGICIGTNAIYVGLSCSRNIHDLDIDSAAVVAIDKSTWDELGRISLPTAEIYGIQLVTDANVVDMTVAILANSSCNPSSHINDQNEQIADRNRQIGELHEKVALLEQRLANLEPELAETAKELSERSNQANSLSTSLTHYQHVNAHLTQTIDQLLNSTSWRITRPLRVIGGKMNAINRATNQLRHYIKQFTDYRALRDCPLFDTHWYLTQYPDIDPNVVHPLRHYLAHGWREGRNPGPEFDGTYYRRRYPDIANLQESPLLHYWRHGRTEGRHINAALDFTQPLSNSCGGTIIPPSNNTTQAESIIISVVIPTYNRLHLLPEIIESWRKVHLHTRCTYEIIFSDDGSTDGSLDYLESITDLPLTVLKNTHGGASAARNSGINAAGGQRVLLMGDDIFPDPEIINIHINLAEQLGDDTAILGAVDWHPGLPLNHLMQHITEIGNEQFSYNRLQDNSFTDFRHFYTCNISINKRFLLGEKYLFDDSFTEYGFEDIELGYRLARRGLKIFYSSLAYGLHYHPYTLESFCRRQISSGKMALVFSRMHPGVEPVLGIPALRKLGAQPISKEEAESWEHRVLMLRQRCNFYERLLFLQSSSELAASVRTALSDIYTRYFKAMYEYGVLQTIGAEAGAMAKAMRSNFDGSWTPYWFHLVAHQLPENLDDDYIKRLTVDSLGVELNVQVHALLDELAILTQCVGGGAHTTNDRFPVSHLVRRTFYHLANNPKYLPWKIAQVLSAKLRRLCATSKAAPRPIIRDAVPGLILEAGNTENSKVIQLFQSIFGQLTALYKYVDDQLVSLNVPELEATVFFWPNLAEALPTADQILTAYVSLVENGNHFSLISNTLEPGGAVSISCIRNHILFSSDMAGAVLNRSLKHVPFRGKILRLLPASHTNVTEPLTRLLDAELYIDSEGNFHNYSQRKPSSILYRSEYLPRSAKDKPVVFVLPIFLAVGGVERNTIEIIRQLRLQFDFVVITMERLRSEQGSLAAQMMDVSFRVLEMAEAVGHHGYLRCLSELKRVFQPDIVWVCNGSPWLCDNAAALRMLFCDTPIIDQKVYDSEEGWINRHQEPGTMSFDRFVAVNKKIERRFRTDFRIPSDRIDLIYSAVDVARIEKFKAENSGINFYQKKFQLPTAKKIFTYVGRLTSQKQPLEFLKLAKARLCNTDEYFVMVGDGELAQPVADFIAQHQLTNVKRISYIENTLELHAVTTGIFFTSAYEGLPIAMIEALAMGVPVFSTDVGDIACTLEQYGGGSVYEVGTPTQTVSRLVDDWLLKQQTYRDNLQRHERSILHRFSSKVISEQYVKCWRVAAEAYGKKIGGPSA